MPACASTLCSLGASGSGASTRLPGSSAAILLDHRIRRRSAPGSPHRQSVSPARPGAARAGIRPGRPGACGRHHRVRRTAGHAPRQSARRSFGHRHGRLRRAGRGLRRCRIAHGLHRLRRRRLLRDMALRSRGCACGGGVATFTRQPATPHRLLRVPSPPNIRCQASRRVGATSAVPSSGLRRRVHGGASAWQDASSKRSGAACCNFVHGRTLRPHWARRRPPAAWAWPDGAVAFGCGAAAASAGVRRRAPIHASDPSDRLGRRASGASGLVVRNQAGRQGGRGHRARHRRQVRQRRFGPLGSVGGGELLHRQQEAPGPVSGSASSG